MFVRELVEAEAEVEKCAWNCDYYATDGPAFLEPPSLDEWPKVEWTPSKEAIRVDLDALTPEIVTSWKPGDRLLLNGKMLTGRDAAHKRIQDMLAKGEALPVE